jgi:hypothetical protein
LEGLLSVTLVVIHCDDLIIIVLRVYKEATVLSVLMKVYTIPCNDRGHINVMLVLQSCTDSLQVMAGSSSGTSPASSDGVCNFSNTEVEEDLDVKEEGFIALIEEADIGIKQEKIAEDINFPDIKSEPVDVSHLYICLFLDKFYQCPEMLFICIFIL